MLINSETPSISEEPSSDSSLLERVSSGLSNKTTRCLFIISCGLLLGMTVSFICAGSSLSSAYDSLNHRVNERNALLSAIVCARRLDLDLGAVDPQIRAVAEIPGVGYGAIRSDGQKSKMMLINEWKGVVWEFAVGGDIPEPLLVPARDGTQILVADRECFGKKCVVAAYSTLAQTELYRTILDKGGNIVAAIEDSPHEYVVITLELMYQNMDKRLNVVKINAVGKLEWGKDFHVDDGVKLSVGKSERLGMYLVLHKSGAILINSAGDNVILPLSECNFTTPITEEPVSGKFVTAQLLWPSRSGVLTIKMLEVNATSADSLVSIQTEFILGDEASFRSFLVRVTKDVYAIALSDSSHSAVYMYNHTTRLAEHHFSSASIETAFSGARGLVLATQKGTAEFDLAGNALAKLRQDIRGPHLLHDRTGLGLVYFGKVQNERFGVRTLYLWDDGSYNQSCPETRTAGLVTDL